MQLYAKKTKEQWSSLRTVNTNTKASYTYLTCYTIELPHLQHVENHGCSCCVRTFLEIRFPIFVQQSTTQIANFYSQLSLTTVWCSILYYYYILYAELLPSSPATSPWMASARNCCEKEKVSSGYNQQANTCADLKISLHPDTTSSLAPNVLFLLSGGELRTHFKALKRIVATSFSTSSPGWLGVFSMSTAHLISQNWGWQTPKD